MSHGKPKFMWHASGAGPLPPLLRQFAR